MRHARKDYERIQDPTGKIPVDEPVFLLRAQDTTAPGVVRAWADKIEGLGGSREIVQKARNHADLMDAWQKQIAVKIPDLPDLAKEAFEKARRNSDPTPEKSVMEEIFKGVTVIGDFPIANLDTDRHPTNVSPITIDYETQTIEFKLQNKPVKDVGVNGCQIETIIEAAMMILQSFNEKIPCLDNEFAINHLDNALLHLDQRKQKLKSR